MRVRVVQNTVTVRGALTVEILKKKARAFEQLFDHVPTIRVVRANFSVPGSTRTVKIDDQTNQHSLIRVVSLDTSSGLVVLDLGHRGVLSMHLETATDLILELL